MQEPVARLALPM